MLFAVSSMSLPIISPPLLSYTPIYTHLYITICLFSKCIGEMQFVEQKKILRKIVNSIQGFLHIERKLMGQAKLFKSFVLSEQPQNTLLETRTQQIHPSSVFLYTPYQVDLRESKSLQLSKLHHRRHHWSSFGLLESPVDCYYYLLHFLRKKEKEKGSLFKVAPFFERLVMTVYSNAFSTFRSVISLKNPTPISPGETAEPYWYKDVLLALNLQSRRIHSLSEKGSTLPPAPQKAIFCRRCHVLSPGREEGCARKPSDSHLLLFYSVLHRTAVTIFQYNERQGTTHRQGRLL